VNEAAAGIYMNVGEKAKGHPQREFSEGEDHHHPSLCYLKMVEEIVHPLFNTILPLHWFFVDYMSRHSGDRF
jgi:hypothetical protein